MTTFNSSTFNEVAMVYITKSLSEQHMSTQLQVEDVSTLKDFLISKFPLFKAEYQALIFQHISQFYCKNMEICSENLDVLISLLSHAYAVGVMKLDKNCWKLWQDLIDQDMKYFYDNKLQSYLKGSGSCKDLIIVLQLLLRHNAKNKDDIFQSVTSVITKLPTSPYLDPQTILNSLEFVRMTLDMLLNQSKPSSSVAGTVFSYASSILQYLHNLMQCDVSTTEAILLEILETCFMIVDCYIAIADSPSFDDKDLLTNCLTNYFSKSLSNTINGLTKLLENLRDTSAQMNGLVAMRSLKFALQWMKSRMSSVDLDQLFPLVFYCATSYSRKDLAAFQKKDTNTKTLNCDAFIVNCWECLGILLSSRQQQHTVTTFLDEDTQAKTSALLDAFQTDLTIASNKILPNLANFASHFVNLFSEDTDQTNLLIHVMWKLLRNQLHSDQTFRKIYKKCIEVFFHDTLLDSSDEKIVNKVNESWQIILELGETKPIVTNIAVEHFLGVCESLISKGSSNILNYIEPLVKIAVFGPLRQKRERPYNDMYSYVMANPSEYDDVENLKSFQSLDQSVRITFTNFILNLPNLKSQQTIDKLVIRLIESFVVYEQNMSTKCYYPNSEHHRKKLRAWQTILILLPQLPKDYDYNELLHQMFLSCKSDNQPSIRYLAEWAIILVLLKDKTMICKLWEDLENSTEKKIMSVTFILSISIQLCKILEDGEFLHFAHSAVPKILPWAHAHHMTSRIHSHIALQNIWNRLQMLVTNMPAAATLKEKFSYLEFCFSLSAKNTAGVKHKQELMKSFFLTKFHAIEDYNLQFIFEIFSKHHGVSYDEWLSVEHFKFKVEENRSSPINLPILRRCKESEKEEEIEVEVTCMFHFFLYSFVMKIIKIYFQKRIPLFCEKNFLKSCILR